MPSKSKKAEELDAFVIRLGKYFGKYCPKDVRFMMLLAQGDDTGRSLHISSFDPLVEAKGLRELAYLIEQEVAETN